MCNEYTYQFKSGAVSYVARAIDIIIQAVNETCKDMDCFETEVVYSTIVKMMSNNDKH